MPLSARSFRALPAFAALACLLTAPLGAAISVTLANPTSLNANGWIIAHDADDPAPGTDREGVKGRVQLTFVGTAGQTPVNWRLRWQLVDDSDAPQDLLSPTDGSVVSEVIQTYQSPPYVSNQSIPVTFNQTLVPAAQLSRSANFRLRFRFQGFAGGNWVDYPNAAGAVRTQSPGRTYLHFTNTVSGDAALNAIPQLTAAAFRRGTLVRSVAGQERWQVDVSGSLTRFDDFAEPLATAEIPLTFTYVLRQQGGAAIALVADTFTLPVNVDAYAATAPLTPAVASFTAALPVEPLNYAEIDPTLTYTLEIAVSTPDGESAALVAGARRLLALSGELRFGSISTQFTTLANDPATTTVAVCGPPEPCWSALLAVSGQSGTLPSAPGRTFGDGTPLSVLVFPDGTAVTQGASVTLTSPAPDFLDYVGVRVLRGPATLSDATGLRLNSLGVFLPQGFSLVRGERTRRARGVIELTNVPVGLDLQPQDLELAITPANVSGTGTLYAQHENFPARVAVGALTWDWQNGLFRITPAAVRFERAWEAAQPGNNARPANDGYFAQLTGTAGGGDVQILTAPGGIARLLAAFTLGPGVYAPLFPAGSAVLWAGDGAVNVTNSAIDAGSYLGGDGVAVVSQNRGCPEFACIGADSIFLNFRLPVGANWRLGPDGSVRGAGAMDAPTTLQWGRQPGSPNYTHETASWTDARFVAAGFLAQPPATPNPQTAPAYDAPLQAPAMLLTGWSSPADEDYVERPAFVAGAPYLLGLADYAGLNFRVGTDNAIVATSRLGGSAPIGYGLRDFVKVYARQGGISGTHQGATGGVTELILYGFRANIGPDPERPANGGLRLAFLDNENVRSLTGGTLLVPGYSNFNQPFKELTFTCYGGPDQALLDSGPQVRNPLRYWGSEFRPLSLSFVPQIGGGSCPSNNAGALVMGARFQLAALSPDPLDATLGFEYDGNLVTPATAAAAGYPADLHSRLTPPTSLRLAATGGEHFPLATRGLAYFNNPRPSPLPYPAPPGIPVTPTSGGWLNVVGALDVPFFHDLKVHLHLDPAAGGSSPVYMMGGWPADDASPDNLGWAAGGKTFFNDPGFDAASLGYDPAGSVAAYRNPPAGEKRHRPRAQQDWLEVVHLDYSVRWDNGRFIPAPGVESETDLLVIRLAHRLLSLSPSTAEVTFGVQYNGLSALNAANLAAAGAGSLFGSVAAALPGAEAIPNATRQFDALLSDQFGARLGASLETALAPALDSAVASLRAQDPSFWLTGTNLAPIVNSLTSGLAAAGAPNLALTTDLRSSLADIDNGLAKLLQLLPAQGANAGSVFGQMVRNLLVDHGPPVPLNAVLDAAFAGASPELDRSLPALFEIRSTLEKARGPVQNALQQIDAGTSPVRAAIASSLQQAPLLTTGLTQHLRAYLMESAPPGQFFAERDAAAVRARLLAIVRENVAASGFAAAIQSTLKNHFSETQRRMRAGFDSFFAETNRLIRDAIRAVAPEIVPDGPFRRGLGELSRTAAGNSAGNSPFGSFNLQGYAAINGDSLQELRLDGKVVLSAPDTMTFQGGVRILALDSRSPAARCFPAGSNPRAEVSLNASAPFPFFGATNATMQAGARFTFADNGLLLGLGGNFGVLGDVQIGGVKLRELKFLFAFGASDNYLGCSARAAFQGYEFAGAFFLGTACGPEALTLLDPDVGLALADAGVGAGSRITGVYIYAEGWMPLNNLIGIPDSCLFSLRAGAGVGPFGFLIDGPTGPSFALGSKLFFGITADILCLAHAEANITLVGSLKIPLSNLQPERGTQSGSQGLALRLRGRGEFEVEVGPCPFCISFSKEVKFHAQLGGGDTRFGFGD
ncbi:MAG: hypothetical protein JSR82_12665 [Verrucomicrobia bacterium]|nr:hypothetical protein [Verrucomicrobiota bacterium]